MKFTRPSFNSLLFAPASPSLSLRVTGPACSTDVLPAALGEAPDGFTDFFSEGRLIFSISFNVLFKIN